MMFVYVKMKASTNASDVTWDRLVAEHSGGKGEARFLSSSTIAFAPLPDEGPLQSVVIYVNCAYVDWFGIDTAHMYAHEIGHGLGLNDTPSSGYDDCTAMSSIGTAFNLATRTLDRKAIACIYGVGDYYLATADPLDAAAAVCDWPSDAMVTDIKFEDDTLYWQVEAENSTAGYELEVSNEEKPRWRRVAVASSGIGPRALSFDGLEPRWVRLNEILVDGRKREVFLKHLTHASPPKVITARASSRRISPSFPQESSATLPPDVVILTMSTFWSSANELAGYWESRGHDVAVELVSGADKYWRRNDAGAKIRSRAASGSKLFHIIGDDEHIAAEYDRALPSNDDDSVYPSSTDQELADVDYNGRPDVVLTRWPANGPNDVSCAHDRIVDHDASTPSFASPLVGAMLVDDRDNALGPVPGYLTGGMATAIQADFNELCRWPQLSRLNSSSYPDADDRNTATVNLLNSLSPQIAVMLASGSTRLSPGNFFEKKNATVPWTNQWLASDLPVILVPSCESSYFVDETSHPQQVCQDFFSKSGPFAICGAGAVIWIGGYRSALSQALNWAFESLVLEELFRIPGRSVADAYLVALNRMYTAFPAADDVWDLNQMIILGDPFSLLQRVPNHRLEAYALRAGTSQLLPMPGNFAVGCPGADGDDIIIKVILDAADVPIPLSNEDITASHKSTADYFSTRMYPDGGDFASAGSIQWSSSDPQFPNGSYQATITMSSFGGCGVDSILVSLYDLPVGYVPVNVRSPDIVTSGVNNTSYGKVTLLDFAEFVKYYPPPKPYAPCADYVSPYGAPITLGDYSYFGIHYVNGHEYTLPAMLAGEVDATMSTGSIHVELTQDDPLIGDRILHAVVRLEGLEPYEALVIALRTGNPDLEYVGWSQDSGYQGQTMCAEIEPEAGRVMFLGAVGSKNAQTGAGTLGEATFRVKSEGPLELAHEDMELVVADILSSEGNQAAMSSSQFQRIVAPIAYPNALAQNFPNPFNPSTTIAFSLKKSQHASLDIFDVRGAHVRTLLQRVIEAGNHRAQWDGMDERGSRVASGVYFCRLQAGAFSQTRKLTMLR